MSIVKRRSRGDNVLRQVVKPLLFIVRHFPPFSTLFAFKHHHICCVAHGLRRGAKEEIRMKMSRREDGKINDELPDQLIYN